jgi:hypothetical protein
LHLKVDYGILNLKSGSAEKAGKKPAFLLNGSIYQVVRTWILRTSSNALIDWQVPFY